MITRIVLDGHACACAIRDTAGKAAAAPAMLRNWRRRSFMACSLGNNLWNTACRGVSFSFQDCPPADGITAENLRLLGRARKGLAASLAQGCRSALVCFHGEFRRITGRGVDSEENGAIGRVGMWRGLRLRDWTRGTRQARQSLRRRPPRPPQFGTATPASERICVKQSFSWREVGCLLSRGSFQQPMCPEVRIEASPKRK
jgi:hypothetical protein